MTKYAQDLYPENYKVLKKDIKDLNEWRDIPCSWIRFNLLKGVNSPKLI